MGPMAGTLSGVNAGTICRRDERREEGEEEEKGDVALGQLLPASQRAHDGRKETHLGEQEARQEEVDEEH